MRTSTHKRSLRRELASRVSGGLRITLYWRTDDNRTTIYVDQPTSGETMSFSVAPNRALDAFYHPFAYLARQEQERKTSGGMASVRLA
jgi:hypothetical protein